MKVERRLGRGGHREEGRGMSWGQESTKTNAIMTPNTSLKHGHPLKHAHAHKFSVTASPHQTGSTDVIQLTLCPQAHICLHLEGLGFVFPSSSSRHAPSSPSPAFLRSASFFFFFFQLPMLRFDMVPSFLG